MKSSNLSSILTPSQTRKNCQPEKYKGQYKQLTQHNISNLLNIRRKEQTTKKNGQAPNSWNKLTEATEPLNSDVVSQRFTPPTWCKNKCLRLSLQNAVWKNGIAAVAPLSGVCKALFLISHLLCHRCCFWRHPVIVIRPCFFHLCLRVDIQFHWSDRCSQTFTVGIL